MGWSLTLNTTQKYAPWSELLTAYTHHGERMGAISIRLTGYAIWREKGAVFARTNLMPINPEADPLAVEEEQWQTA